MALTYDGTAGITFPDGTQLQSGKSLGIRNRIINGAMVIDQRNNGAVINPAINNTYCVDRFLTYSTQASFFKIGQNLNSVTPPIGFKNYLGAQSLAASTAASGDLYLIAQKIEGYNVADLGWGATGAASVTLSFWVYSSLTGTFGGALTNNTVTYASYPFSYTISVANTWTYITITIPGPTTGTWGVTNSQSIFVSFDLGSGSSNKAAAGSWNTSAVYGATGTQSVVGTSGATFYITGVQLEVGSTATSFDYRPYGTELALCQRYYFQLGGAAGQRFAIGWWYSTIGPLGHMIYFPVCMRSPSSISFSYSSLSDFYVYTTSTSITPTSMVIASADVNCAAIDLSVASGGTAGQASALLAQSTNARLKFSNEL